MSINSGEIVEVRSENEILGTLDENGELEGLPFIQDMRKYCGRRFRVLRRVNRIIIEGVGEGRIRNTVILEGVTCDGESNEGCQRTCPLLWKEAWLKKSDSSLTERRAVGNMASTRSGWVGTSEALLKCQPVNLTRAMLPLHKWDFRLYIWDITSGIYGPLERVRMLFDSLSLKIQELLTGGRSSMLSGRLRRTPSVELNLQSGEIVQVKNKEEILKTLDTHGKNRGLMFTPEMEKYCGKRFQVLKRLDKMVNEKTGEMRKIANTVLLQGSTCDGKAHGGCQRLCYCLWREIWLRRVND